MENVWRDHNNSGGIERVFGNNLNIIELNKYSLYKRIISFSCSELVIVTFIKWTRGKHTFLVA